MNDSEPPKHPKTQPDLDGGPPRPPKITARDLEDDSPEDESILDELRRRMRRFPNARVQQNDWSIAYIPDDAEGFIVRLKVQMRSGKQVYAVYYGPVFREFERRDLAVTQFGYGLSSSSRVLEYARSGRAFRWRAQTWFGDWIGWREEANGIDWLGEYRQFWKTPTVRVLQNHLIDLDAPDLSCAA